jgi:hypothetical protein
LDPNRSGAASKAIVTIRVKVTRECVFFTRISAREQDGGVKGHKQLIRHVSCSSRRLNAAVH